MSQSYNTASGDDDACTATGADKPRNTGQRSGAPLSTTDRTRPDGFADFQWLYARLRDIAASQWRHLADVALLLEQPYKLILKLAPTVFFLCFYFLIFGSVLCFVLVSTSPSESKIKSKSKADVVSMAVAGFEHRTLVAACVVSIIYAAIIRVMYHSEIPHRIPRRQGVGLTFWWTVSIVSILLLWEYELFRGIYIMVMSCVGPFFFLFAIASPDYHLE